MCGKIVVLGEISLCFILSLYQCALVGIPGRLFYQYFILGLVRECGGDVQTLPYLQWITNRSY